MVAMSEESRGPVPSAEESGDARRRWLEERTTFQRVYDVVTGLTRFETAGDVADRADCSTDGARNALSQLVEMGVAERRGERPVKYRRNESYFRWRRVEELVRNNTAADLRTRLEELLQEDESLRERFDAPGPESVPPSTFETADHEAVHDRWDALNWWRTVRDDITVLQRAIHRAERRKRNGDHVAA